jgi:hypothetical protein
MIGPSAAFCSWNPEASPVKDVTTGWPFVFARPLMATASQPPAACAV